MRLVYTDQQYACKTIEGGRARQHAKPDMTRTSIPCAAVGDKDHTQCAWADAVVRVLLSESCLIKEGDDHVHVI